MLEKLHEVVTNINNYNSNNNYLNSANNNFTWDASHDYPVYDDHESDDFFDLEDMLCGAGSGMLQTREGRSDVPQTREGGSDVPQTLEGGSDVPQTCGKVPDVPQTREEVPNVP